ncbi:MAG: hypothetical protein R2828_29835 [Saprospiraceae bacterium]
MKEVKYQTPKVVEIFHEWYGQLSDNDKSIICTHLRHWLKSDGLISKLYSQTQPHFGGRQYGAPNARMVSNNEQLKCSNCGTEINLVSCGKCGNQIEIK